MRVLVVDPDPARAALVVAGLGDIDPLEVRSVLGFEAAQTDPAAFARTEGLDVGLAGMDDARWLLADMIDARQGKASEATSRLAEAMMRPDLYAQACAGLDLS